MISGGNQAAENLDRQVAALDEEISRLVDAIAAGGARALGLENKVGVVAEGRRADLVVLTANPLEDIRATRAIDVVIAKGRAYEPRELLK